MNLIAAYKALGGGWQRRENQPFINNENKSEMQQCTNWGERPTCRAWTQCRERSSARAENEQAKPRFLWGESRRLPEKVQDGLFQGRLDRSLTEEITNFFEPMKFVEQT